ncbi:MAG: Hsp20/alpha crystallin family protein [Burkholderiaceae bacterium]
MSNNLMHFEPFRGIDDFFKDFQWRPMMRNLDVEPRIKMDVSETDTAYTVKAEIPGVKKEDIKVSVEGNQVSISAEVKNEKEEKKGETVVRSERYYGLQSRSFTLAHDINDEQTQAKYQDGVLELILPKKAASSGKKITIN